jgi:hypothetical protein
MSQPSQAPKPESGLTDADRDTLSRTGLLPKDLAEQFNSLGDNCEFGFVQRHFGAEPLGAFRFSNPKADKILQGIQTRFEGLGRNAHAKLDAQTPPEWIIIEPDYHLRQHTFIRKGNPREVSIHADAAQFFTLTKRELLDDLDAGDKFFVIKSVPNLPLESAEKIAAAMRLYGPNWLLWVVDEPGGPNVEIVREGLLKACVNGIQPQGHPQWGKFPFAQWLEAMVQAWELVRSLRHQSDT